MCFLCKIPGLRSLLQNTFLVVSLNAPDVGSKGFLCVSARSDRLRGSVRSVEGIRVLEDKGSVGDRVPSTSVDGTAVLE